MHLIDISTTINDFKTFSIEQLSSSTGINISEITMMQNSNSRFYAKCFIPKKQGGFREIFIPDEPLKIIQKWILKNILEKISVSEHCYGFRKGYSIVDNSMNHVAKPCLVCLDIENFFPSITYSDIYNVFANLGFSSENSQLLSSLCTLNNMLPQGSSTSPYLSNIKCIELDNKLFELASQINATYTRYADDITFSGDRSISKSLPDIYQIITRYGFKINIKKTRTVFQGRRQMVTGLVVNEKVSIPIEVKRFMRQQIYYCKKYGVNEHLKRFKYPKKYYRRYIYGLCSFIKMAQPEAGEGFYEQLNEIQW